MFAVRNYIFDLPRSLGLREGRSQGIATLLLCKSCFRLGLVDSWALKHVATSCKSALATTIFCKEFCHSALPVNIDDGESLANTYRGITRVGNRWVAKYERKHIATFPTAKLAALCVDQVEFALTKQQGRHFSFPDRDYSLDPVVGRLSGLTGVEEMIAEVRKLVHPTKEGRFRGVERSGSKYRAKIHSNNEYVFLGSFPDAAAAASCWDVAALRLRGPFTFLNFPDMRSAYEDKLRNFEHITGDAEFLEQYCKQYRKQLSSWAGVYLGSSGTHYFSAIAVGQHPHYNFVFLGHGYSPEELARVYDRAVLWFGLERRKRMNYPAEDYSQDPLLLDSHAQGHSDEQFAHACRDYMGVIRDTLGAIL